VKELQFSTTLRLGSRGRQVKTVQEWLVLRGYRLAIDGVLGPATRLRIERFQARHGLHPDGRVGRDTFAALTAPIARAVARPPREGRAVGAYLCAVALRHLRERPREVGGPCRGPWVRLYTNGREGLPSLVCPGFVHFVLRQATYRTGVRHAVAPSATFEELGLAARERGALVPSEEAKRGHPLPPGAIALLRGTRGRWTHAGIVIRRRRARIEIIGADSEKMRKGGPFRVAVHTRSLDGADFILPPEPPARPRPAISPPLPRAPGQAEPPEVATRLGASRLRRGR
jgi:hypothetical protein